MSETAGQQDAGTDVPAAPALDSEEIPEYFTCCVCLDLLYKPVLLSCGHMSCFWCVHKCMNAFHESQCPICRHPYIHFPSICPMLHFLLLKMYPVTYASREKEIREKETEMRISSPQLDAGLLRSLGNGHLSGGNLSQSSPTNQGLSVGRSPNGDSQPSTSLIHAGSEDIAQIDHISYTRVLSEGSQSQDLPGNQLTESQNKISITDVLCGLCKQLLFRPVSLNCGHVFCKSCIPNSIPKEFECPVCQSPHPRGSPKVCLALGHFLEEEFSDDYALRKSVAQPDEISPRNESPKKGNSGAGDDKRNPSWGTNPLNTHFQVGCDFCGMFPIVGDRYKCQDCEEVIGFDLCGDCYNSRRELPGRFNQQHKPEHRFNLIRPYNMQRWVSRFLIGQPSSDSSASAVQPDEEAENAILSPMGSDTREDDDNYDMHIGIAMVEDDDEDEPPSS